MKGYRFRNFIDCHRATFGSETEFNGRARFWVKYGLWGLVIQRAWSSWALAAFLSPRRWRVKGGVMEGRRYFWAGPFLLVPMVQGKVRYFVNHPDGTSTEFPSLEDMNRWKSEHERLTGNGTKNPFYWDRAMKAVEK